MGRGLQSRPGPRAESRDVVRQLIGYICGEGLAVGERLPSIRQLAQRFQAGPNVVRDALVQAQTMGLVRIHPRAGVFVQSLTFAPLVGALAETLKAALMQVDYHLFHLLDARRLIEVELAARVAERRRLEDLLPVRQALDDMARHMRASRWADFVEADVRFHLAIAKAAAQPVLEIVLHALLGLLRPYLVGLPWTPEREVRTEHGHNEIYRALLEGSPAKARAVVDEQLGLATRHILNILHADLEGGGGRQGGAGGNAR